MQRYLETRTAYQTNGTSAASDVARHLLARQHLGRTLIVCDKPATTIGVIRKYWLKLARGLQRERSSTLNAERILQLTHDITHMHHMEFVTKPFYINPHADVYFVRPDQIDQVPTRCFNLYILDAPTEGRLIDAISQLADRSLVIDYTDVCTTTSTPLLPKQVLQRQIPDAWQAVEQFMIDHNVDLEAIVRMPLRDQAINDALDNLLDSSSRFLRIANNFLELLRLAQPIDTTNTQQQSYDLLASLHRRIYALTPGSLSQQFIQAFSDDDPPFMSARTDAYTQILAPA